MQAASASLPWGFFAAGFFAAGFGFFALGLLYCRFRCRRLLAWRFRWYWAASLQVASASLSWGFFTAGFVAGGSLLGVFDGTHCLAFSMVLGLLCRRLLCRGLRLLCPGASLPLVSLQAAPCLAFSMVLGGFFTGGFGFFALGLLYRRLRCRHLLAWPF